MRFTLLTATYGRAEPLQRMLHGLAAQTFRDFELVIIDQNTDDRVQKIMRGLPEWLPVKYLFSSPPGLVAALNVGLSDLSGEIVGFPDDDCQYPADLLQKLDQLLSDHPEWDGITVCTQDDLGKPSIARWDKEPGKLTKSNLGMRGCSTSVFYRSNVCKAIGPFRNPIPDDPVAPGFDMDYLHRTIKAGYHVEFQPQFCICHPQTLPPGPATDEILRKRYNYGFGEGTIARRYSLPAWYVAGIIVSPMIRSIRYIAFGPRNEARKQWETFRGRLIGWWSGRPVKPNRKEASPKS